MFSKAAALLFLATALPGLAQTSAPQRARSLSERRVASRGYLGVGVVELTGERVQALKLKDDRGVEVLRVDENSPADRAGLKENDVLLEVNGKAIEGLEQFQTTIAETQPGAKVTIAVWRNGAKRTVSATLDARADNFFPFGGPDDADSPAPPLPPLPFIGAGPFPGLPGDSPRVGFEGESVTGQLADFFGVRAGVLVRSVSADTPAARAGLKAGDVVVKVNGTPVTSPREITGAVRNSEKKTLSFTVVRNKKEMPLALTFFANRNPASPNSN